MESEAEGRPAGELDVTPNQKVAQSVSHRGRKLMWLKDSSSNCIRGEVLVTQMTSTVTGPSPALFHDAPQAQVTRCLLITRSLYCIGYTPSTIPNQANAWASSLPRNDGTAVVCGEARRGSSPAISLTELLELAPSGQRSSRYHEPHSSLH